MTLQPPILTVAVAAAAVVMIQKNLRNPNDNTGKFCYIHECNKSDVNYDLEFLKNCRREGLERQKA